MTQVIDPYSEAFLPNFIKTDYNQSLAINEAKIKKRQADYDDAYAKLSTLRSNALNMNMLYEEGKETLDNYNKDLGVLFSQDLGDLSKGENQVKFIEPFKKIAGDTRLRTMHLKSNEILKDIEVRDKAKMSDNPYKEGYSDMNDWVFNYELNQHLAKSNTQKKDNSEIYLS